MKKSLPRILTASGGNSLARLRPLICPIVRGHWFAQTRTHSCARAYARMHARRCARARKNAPKRASAQTRVTHTVCSCSRAASEATLRYRLHVKLCCFACAYRPQRIGSRPDPPVDPARPTCTKNPPSSSQCRLVTAPSAARIALTASAGRYSKYPFGTRLRYACREDPSDAAWLGRLR